MFFFPPVLLRGIVLLLVGLGSPLVSAAQTTPSSWAWARGLHGPGDDAFTAVTNDAAGNTYAVGYFEQIATVGGLSLTSRGEADAVVVKYDPTGVPVWVRHFGGTQFDRADQVAVDAQGNVYVAGLFEGTATFGGVTLTTYGTGFYVVKLDAQGTVQWGQMADSSNFTASYGLQPDGAGGAYVAGIFTNGVRMGDVSLPTDIGGAILARLDAQGNVLWARQQASRILFTGFNQLTGYGLAVGGGYVYAAGDFAGTVEFSGTTLQSPDNNDAWLASYDADGNLRWIRQGGNPTSYDVAHAVVADAANGQVYISGQFQGSATFGELTLSATGPASDAFLVKYDAQGTALWARQLGSTGKEVGYGVTLDAQGNVYQAGSYSAGTQVGGVLLPHQGDLDAYVLSYTSQGALRWVQAAGGPGNDIPIGLTAPDAGVLLPTGRIYTLRNLPAIARFLRPA